MSPDTPSCDSTFPGITIDEFKCGLVDIFYSTSSPAISRCIYLTGSYILLGLDDSCVDDVLGDGIHDQDLLDNDCYKEIQSHMDLRGVSRNDHETVTAEEVVKALIRNTATLPDPIKKRLLDYQVHFALLFTHLSNRKIIFYYDDHKRYNYRFAYIRLFIQAMYNYLNVYCL